MNTLSNFRTYAGNLSPCQVRLAKLYFYDKEGFAKEVIHGEEAEERGKEGLQCEDAGCLNIPAPISPAQPVCILNAICRSVTRRNVRYLKGGKSNVPLSMWLCQ